MCKKRGFGLGRWMPIYNEHCHELDSVDEDDTYDDEEDFETEVYVKNKQSSKSELLDMDFVLSTDPAWE